MDVATDSAEQLIGKSNRNVRKPDGMADKKMDVAKKALDREIDKDNNEDTA